MDNCSNYDDVIEHNNKQIEKLTIKNDDNKFLKMGDNDEKDYYEVRYIIIGDSAVGKTNIIYRFIQVAQKIKDKTKISLENILV